jgi:DNA-binding transcriptional regulator YdaS (Cro superfamily)
MDKLGLSAMKKPRPETIALLHAVDILGGQTATAKAFGVTQQAVHDWTRRGKVPALKAIALEAASGVSRHKLRPDLYP